MSTHKSCINCPAPISSRATYCGDACRISYKRHQADELRAELEAKRDPETKAYIAKVDKHLEDVEKRKKNAADEAWERLLKSVGMDSWEQNTKLEYISTGFEELDKMIAMNHRGEYTMVDGKYFGGFPRSAVSEIYGRKGVGKSNWLLRVLPKQVGSMLYFDTEGSTKEGPEAIPVPDNVKVVRTNSLENVWQLTNQAVFDDIFDVVVVDGIAGLTTNREIAAGNDPGGFQDRAKLISNWLRTMEDKMRNSRTAVIFTNQQKESMDPFKPKQTMGGSAVAYYCSLRLELLSTPSSAKIVRNGVKVGHKIRVKLDKSRFGPDGQETEFKFMFEDLG